MRKCLCSMAIALFLVSSVATAKAEVFIDSWTYSVSGIFTEWSSDASNGSSGIYTRSAATLNGTNGYRDLSWGPADALWGIIDNYNSRSGVTISDTANGTVYTNGDDALGITLTHRNKSIDATYAALTGGKVYLTLTLTANGVDGQVLEFDTTLSFNFMETTNTGSLQDDIFIVTNVEASMESFEYEGYWYNFSFTNSFVVLNEAYPAYVNAYLDAGNPYYGWVTQEGRTTTIDTYLSVSSGKLDQPTPTPEPGTVLLMGAGLASLAFVARRRLNK